MQALGRMPVGRALSHLMRFLMRRGDWRTTFQGKQAIKQVRKVMGDYLSDLEAGHAEDVRESLRRRRWKRHYDWTGVPRAMVRRLDEECDEAETLLSRHDPDVSGAREAIEKVLDYWLG